MATFQRAVPVLQVTDVERSLRWYADVLEFRPNAFPDKPPYSFAMLRRDDAEIMLQRAPAAQRADAKVTLRTDYGWAVYLRVTGTQILDLAGAIGQKMKLLRGPERMFYGLVEFEILDPDGYRVCLSGDAPAGANVAARREEE
jgi:catechol 2,3-dioxygenase-like lactoylglutathione lyase family enzyme